VLYEVVLTDKWVTLFGFLIVMIFSESNQFFDCSTPHVAYRSPAHAVDLFKLYKI